MHRRNMLFGLICAVSLVPATALGQQKSASPTLHELIAKHAAANGVPAELVHRVVRIESNYNPKARGRDGAMGLMQIKHQTARGVGYRGTQAGLLDADTNLKYGVRYLAGAYRVADGNHERAIAYYQSGYYYAARARGMAAR